VIEAVPAHGAEAHKKPAGFPLAVYRAPFNISRALARPKRGVRGKKGCKKRGERTVYVRTWY
jgi:ribosomal protein S14